MARIAGANLVHQFQAVKSCSRRWGLQQLPKSSSTSPAAAKSRLSEPSSDRGLILSHVLKAFQLYIAVFPIAAAVLWAAPPVEHTAQHPVRGSCTCAISPDRMACVAVEWSSQLANAL